MGYEGIITFLIRWPNSLCHYTHDKESLQRVLEYPELPMHSQLNRFVSASKIDHKQLLDSLHVSTPLPPAYKALEQIGYGEQ